MNRRGFIKNIGLLGSGALIPFNLFSNNIYTEVLNLKHSYFNILYNFNGEILYKKYNNVYTYRGSLEELKKYYNGSTILLYENQGNYIRAYIVPKDIKVLKIEYYPYEK